MAGGNMQGNIANVRRWSEQVDIDWFTYFIKAWIPFNAWFQNAFEEDAERKIINELKTSNNPVRGHILHLLREDYDDAVSFKQQISSLHVRLSAEEIRNRNRVVSFEQCYLGANPKKTARETHSGLEYLVERGEGHVRNSEVFAEVKRRDATVAFTLTQTKYDLISFRADPGFRGLAPAQQTRLEFHYGSVAPDRIASLLASPGDAPETKLVVGAFDFRNEPYLIFEGLLEILYALRCLLFHGEIEPTNRYRNIYEPAYFILRRFLACIE